MADENATAPDAETSNDASGQTEATSAGTTAATSDAVAAPEYDWRQGLPDDLATVASKFTSPAAALKSYKELESRLGKSVSLPGKDATPEEIAAFRKRALGVPDSADGYEIKLPEGLELTDDLQSSLTAFKERMHAAGASPAVVQEAVAFELETAQRLDEARKADMAKRAEEAISTLKSEWRGADYERNVELAKRAVKTFDGDGEFAKFLETAEVDGIRAGDHPQFLKLFAKVARGMTEDTVHIGPSRDEAETLQERANEARAKRNEARQKGDYKAVERYDAEERQLLSRLHGSAPIVGSQGRVA